MHRPDEPFVLSTPVLWPLECLLSIRIFRCIYPVLDSVWTKIQRFAAKLDAVSLLPVHKCKKSTTGDRPVLFELTSLWETRKISFFCSLFPAGFYLVLFREPSLRLVCICHSFSHVGYCGQQILFGFCGRMLLSAHTGNHHSVRWIAQKTSWMWIYQPSQGSQRIPVGCTATRSLSLFPCLLCATVGLPHILQALWGTPVAPRPRRDEGRCTLQSWMYKQPLPHSSALNWSSTKLRNCTVWIKRDTTNLCWFFGSLQSLLQAVLSPCQFSPKQQQRPKEFCREHFSHSSVVQLCLWKGLRLQNIEEISVHHLSVHTSLQCFLPLWWKNHLCIHSGRIRLFRFLRQSFCSNLEPVFGCQCTQSRHSDVSSPRSRWSYRPI